MGSSGTSDSDEWRQLSRHSVWQWNPSLVDRLVATRITSCLEVLRSEWLVRSFWALLKLTDLHGGLSLEKERADPLVGSKTPAQAITITSSLDIFLSSCSDSGTDEIESDLIKSCVELVQFLNEMGAHVALHGANWYGSTVTPKLRAILSIALTFLTSSWQVQ